MSDDDDSNAGVYAPHADGAQLPSTSQQAAQISVSHHCSFVSGLLNDLFDIEN